MRGPAQLASYLGMGMAVVGLALIGLAWNGAADLDYIQGQFPYLLSGGLTGVGLVLTGMAVVGIQSFRTISAESSRRLARVNAAMTDLVALMGATDTAAAVLPGPRVEAGTRTRPESGAELGGAHPEITEHFTEPDLAWGPDAVDEEEYLEPVYVISGRTSFHRPDCRLVADRGDLEVLERAEVADYDLSACRICKP